MCKIILTCDRVLRYQCVRLYLYQCTKWIGHESSEARILLHDLLHNITENELEYIAEVHSSTRNTVPEIQYLKYSTWNTVPEIQYLKYSTWNAVLLFLSYCFFKGKVSVYTNYQYIQKNIIVFDTERNWNSILISSISL